MIYKTFWVCTDNLFISGKVVMKGGKVTLPLNSNTQSLLKSGVLSDAKPKVIYNVKKETNPLVLPNEVDEEMTPVIREDKPKRRKKRNGRKSPERVSDLRSTSEAVLEGLPGAESAD